MNIEYDRLTLNACFELVEQHLCAYIVHEDSDEFIFEDGTSILFLY